MMGWQHSAVMGKEGLWGDSVSLLGAGAGKSEGAGSGTMSKAVLVTLLEDLI